LIFPETASLAVVLPALALAAIKEFWFDATYETPKQTFANNATDFGGYSLGIGLASWVWRWLVSL